MYNQKLNLQIWLKFVLCSVHSIIISVEFHQVYPCETWVLKANTTDCMKAYETWIFRRLLKIWISKTTHKDIYECRKLEYICLLMHSPKYGLL